MQFQFCQVVFCNLHIIARHVVALEVCHSHEWLLIIHSFIYQFCCGMLMNGIVHLVLHGSEKHLCHLRTWIIVRRGSIDVRHLLIEISFTTTDVSNTLQQFTEVAIPSLLQSFIIHRESLLDILMQSLCCPTTETHSYGRLYTITNSNNDIKIIMRKTTLNLSIPFFTNLQIIFASCLFIQFTILINIGYVIVNILSCSGINLSNEIVSQPHILISKTHIHAHLAILIFIQYYLILLVHIVLH